MTLRLQLFRLALALLACAGLAGCFPNGQSQMEEEKEPHFMAGKSRINSMDYKGAIEEFQRALEINPGSAAAHFQLGWLFEDKQPDPAAAIYHYEQFLKLRPNADNAEVIRQHIINCKQDLAKTVFPLQATPAMQRDLEQMADEIRRLREENERWKTYYAANRLPTPTNLPAQPAAAQRPPTSGGPMVTGQNSPETVPSTPRDPASTMRTHTVQPGESPFSIARKYGVKLEALMSANPGLDPRRMRVGQTLNIPSS